MLSRTITPYIEKNLFKGKILIIYGARRTGKTTIARNLIKKHSDQSIYLNCDEPDVKEALTNKTSSALKSYIGNRKLVVIDEAQRVADIGITLKLLVDNYPKMQIIATGSSSFELSNRIIEPLTGRKIETYLFPISVEEYCQHYSRLEITRTIDQHLVYGMYPEILNQPEDRIQVLQELTRSYLYKDILQFQNIKNPDMLEKLLQLLALQIGNEVSYTELASSLNIDKKTVENYVSILEKAFIIFRLKPFSRNLRNELKKTRKIYFWDIGIRNMIINNLNPLTIRQDTGHLWENFLISERLKFNNNHQLNKNSYFWRNHLKQEIDYLEDYADKLHAYEIKLNKDKAKVPAVFQDTYKGSEFKLVNKQNYLDFVMG